MTTTSVPAVTTVFTPPSSCLGSTYTLGPQGVDLIDDRKTQTLYKAYSSECYPSQATLSDGYVYLSPGLCPSAWTIASQWSEGTRSTSTRLAYCCPWGLRVSDDFYDCGSYPSLSSVILISDRTPVATQAYPFQTPIMIAWESSDLSTLEHHPTATGTWNIASNITSPAATTAPKPTSPTGSSSIAVDASATSQSRPGDNHVSLSPGSKAGIGVGVAAFSITIALTALIIWRRLRPRRKAENIGVACDEPIEVHIEPKQMAQLGNDGMIHEAGDGWKPTELGDDVRVELEGDAVVGAPHFSPRGR